VGHICKSFLGIGLGLILGGDIWVEFKGYMKAHLKVDICKVQKKRTIEINWHKEKRF